MAGNRFLFFHLILWLPLGAWAADSPLSTPNPRVLRLDEIARPSAPLSFRVRVEPWVEFWLTSPLRRPFEAIRRSEEMGRVEREFGSAGAGIFRLLAAPGITQGAFASWPSRMIRGVTQPVWMAGVASDTGADMNAVVARFLEWCEMKPDRIIQSEYRGFDILTLPFPQRHLHLTMDAQHIILSPDLPMLQEYLRGYPEEPPKPDWPEKDAILVWNPNALLEGGAAVPKNRWSGLRSWGIDRVEISARTFQSGLEILVTLLMDHALEEEVEGNPVDLDLLASVPRGSDLVLVGGGIPNATRFADSSVAGWDRFARLLGEPFAFGVGVPDATGQTPQGLKIGGVFKKPPAPAAPVPVESEESLFPGEVSRDRWSWGGLSLNIASREDWVQVSNTQDIYGVEWRGPSLEDLEPWKDTPPIVAGSLSSKVLLRPINSLVRTDPNRDDRFDFLLPFVRSMAGPVHLSVHLTPRGPQLRVSSPSSVSPFLFFVSALLALDHLDLEDPSGFVRMWSN